MYMEDIKTLIMFWQDWKNRFVSIIILFSILSFKFWQDWKNRFVSIKEREKYENG